ncbi:MAG: hypothetical protein ACPLRW_13520, partial [Moorellales bacterium]
HYHGQRRVLDSFAEVGCVFRLIECHAIFFSVAVALSITTGLNLGRFWTVFWTILLAVLILRATRPTYSHNVSRYFIVVRKKGTCGTSRKRPYNPSSTCAHIPRR